MWSAVGAKSFNLCFLVKRIDIICLVLAFFLLAFGPKKMPPGGVRVVYGCPGNWSVFYTTNPVACIVVASNGPRLDYVWGVSSVALFPTVCYTNFIRL